MFIRPFIFISLSDLLLYINLKINNFVFCHEIHENETLSCKALFINFVLRTNQIESLMH